MNLELQARIARLIYCDVAKRYLQRYGGNIVRIETDADAESTFLYSRNWKLVGRISSLSQYPKPAVFTQPISEIPY